MVYVLGKETRNMRITDQNDDAKLAALNRPAALRRAEKPVAPTQGVQPLQPVSHEHEHYNRSHDERRHVQRRQHPEQESLLDTRDPHDRRKRVRRAEDRLTGENPPQGIDVLA
jgi:hypothetical protein